MIYFVMVLKGRGSTACGKTRFGVAQRLPRGHWSLFSGKAFRPGGGGIEFFGKL
jgi:hypothetical protein